MTKSSLKAKINKTTIGAFLLRSLQNIFIVAMFSFLGVALISLVSFFSISYWLSDNQEKILGSRALSYLETAINTYSSNKTKFDNVKLHLNDNGALRISANFEIYNNFGKEAFLKVQDMSIKTETKGFLTKKSLPFDIQINGLELDVNTIPKKRVIRNAFTNPSKKQNINKKIQNKLKFFSPNSMLYIRDIDINNSKIIKNDTIYLLKQSSHSESNHFISTIFLSHKQHSASVKVSLRDNQTSTSFSSEISHLPTWIIAEMFSPEFSSKLDSKLETIGNIKFDYDKKSNIHKLHLHLKSNNVTSDDFISKFHISADNYKDEKQLELKDLSLSMNHTEEITATGSFDIENNLEIEQMDVVAKNLSVTNLISLWPEAANAETRSWVKNSIPHGNLDAKIHWNTKRSLITNEPIATVDYKDLTLNYANDFDPLTHLNGHITFSRDSTNIHVKDGYLLSSKISNATAIIDHIDPRMPLAIDVTTDGQLKDHVRFLGDDAILALSNKKIDIKNIGGTVKSKVQLLIPLEDGSSTEDIEISAKAQIHNLHSSVLGLVNIEEGVFDLSIADNLMTLSGTSNVNKQPCNIVLSSNFKENEEFQTKISVTTKIKDIKDFSKLFANKFKVEEGEMPAEFTYIYARDNEKIIANFDIDKAKFSLPDIGLVKEKNDKSSLQFELVKSENSNWKTESFSLVSPKIDIHSFMEITPDFSEILEFNCDTHYHGSDFKIKYTSRDDKKNIKIQGQEIHLEDANFFNLTNIGMYEKDDNNLDNTTSHKKTFLSIQIDKLFMKNKIIFHNIIGNFECYKNHCVNSGFSMEINNKDHLKISIDEDKNNSWIFKTNNAASLLKGLGIYKEIEGGELEAHIHYANAAAIESKSPIIVGRLSMKNFKAIKTPTIAKIILLSPFNIIKRSLSDSSLIPFENMEASFVFSNQKLEINRSYAIGKILSMSIEGSIDNKKDAINLKGKLIPKSNFNTILGSVLNDKSSALQKEGIIGNDFEITGKIDNPTVHMNPIGAIVSFLLRLNPLGVA